MPYRFLEVTTDGLVSIIVLNRPEAMNALTRDMLAELNDAIQAADADDNVRSVVLTGKGRAFCAGADIGAAVAGGQQAVSSGQSSLVQRVKVGRTGIQKVARAMESLSKPCVAAVNGAAVGGGMDIASMADIRIAADTARFGMTHLKVCRLSLDGGYYYMQRIVGFARTMELVMRGRMFSAQEALDMGYVTEVASPDHLMERALAIAREVAEMPPVATHFAKQLVKDASGGSLEDALHAAEMATAFLAGTEDFVEGPRAQKEKRKPSFTGK